MLHCWNTSGSGDRSECIWIKQVIQQATGLAPFWFVFSPSKTSWLGLLPPEFFALPSGHYLQHLQLPPSFAKGRAPRTHAEEHICQLPGHFVSDVHPAGWTTLACILSACCRLSCRAGGSFASFLLLIFIKLVGFSLLVASVLLSNMLRTRWFQVNKGGQ